MDLSADGGLPASLLVRGDRVAVSAATARELGVGRGDRLALDTPTGTESVEVAAVLDDPQRRLDGVLVADIAAAQELLGRVGGLGRIELILADDEVSRVRALLAADQQLLPAGRRQAALAGMSDAFHINLRALSLLALVVGLFLVLNTMSPLVVRRRAMLATLRAVGASRGQVVVQVLADAALLAVAGTLIGLPLGADPRYRLEQPGGGHRGPALPLHRRGGSLAAPGACDEALFSGLGRAPGCRPARRGGGRIGAAPRGPGTGGPGGPGTTHGPADGRRWRRAAGGRCPADRRQ
ncbi:MAG: FtsX-like permease family protein [Arhodomonas sp.]|nr:FtsX-like permease family protein [Arhodomonas sp.]